ncbi:hypothetical protein Tco_0326787 [Tanacetum coccineum]
MDNMHARSPCYLLDESDSDNSSNDEVVDLSLSLGSSSKTSSHGASTTRTVSSGGSFGSVSSGGSFNSVSSGGSFDSVRKRTMTNFHKYPHTLYNSNDRFRTPFDKHCLDKESPEKTFISCDTLLKNIREETERKLNVLNNMGPLPLKISQPEVPITINFIDNNPDVCILEDMSLRPPKKRCHTDMKSDMSGQWSSPGAPTTHDVSNHTSFKKKDEQSVYRAALQDLAQPNFGSYKMKVTSVLNRQHSF